MTSSSQPALFPAAESLPAVVPARISQSPAAARAWAEHVQGSSGTSCGSLTSCVHAGSYLRTCRACSRPSARAPVTRPAWQTDALFGADGGTSETESVSSSPMSSTFPKAVPALAGAWDSTEEPWVPSSGRWENAGMGSPTEFWTLSFSASPSAAVASSLPDVLETGPHLSGYSLSPKAARGILRRAARRGREIPGTLRVALETLAQSEPSAVSGLAADGGSGPTRPPPDSLSSQPSRGADVAATG